MGKSLLVFFFALLSLSAVVSASFQVSSQGTHTVGSFSFSSNSNLDVPCVPGSFGTTELSPNSLFFCNSNQHWGALFQSAPEGLFVEHTVEGVSAWAWNPFLGFEHPESCASINKLASSLGATATDGFYWCHSAGADIHPELCRFAHNHPDEDTISWNLLGLIQYSSDRWTFNSSTWSTSDPFLAGVGNLNEDITKFEAKTDYYSTLGLTHLLFEIRLTKSQAASLGISETLHTVAFSLDKSLVGQTASMLFPLSGVIPTSSTHGVALSTTRLFGGSTELLVVNPICFLDRFTTDGTDPTITHSDACHITLSSAHRDIASAMTEKVSLCLGRVRGLIEPTFVKFPDMVVRSSSASFAYFGNGDTMSLPGTVLIYGA